MKNRGLDVWISAPGEKPVGELRHFAYAAPGLVYSIDEENCRKFRDFIRVFEKPGSATRLLYESGTVDLTPFIAASPGKQERLRFWPFSISNAPLNGVGVMPEYTSQLVGQALPVVLFTHGNITAPATPGSYIANACTDFLPYATHLASHGFFCISIDVAFLSSLHKEPADMAMRAWLILEHLRMLREWSRTPGHALYGRLNMSSVLLVGHSRGGEAVVHASAINLSREFTIRLNDEDRTFSTSKKKTTYRKIGPYRFGFRGVVSLAPTNRYPLKLGGQPESYARACTNYLLVQGSQDTEMSVSGLKGFEMFDKARQVSRANRKMIRTLLWIYGGGHYAFFCPEESCYSQVMGSSPSRMLCTIAPIKNRPPSDPDWLPQKDFFIREFILKKGLASSVQPQDLLERLAWPNRYTAKNDTIPPDILQELEQLLKQSGHPISEALDNYVNACLLFRRLVRIWLTAFAYTTLRQTNVYRPLLSHSYDQQVKKWLPEYCPPLKTQFLADRTDFLISNILNPENPMPKKAALLKPFIGQVEFSSHLIITPFSRRYGDYRDSCCEALKIKWQCEGQQIQLFFEQPPARRYPVFSFDLCLHYQGCAIVDHQGYCGRTHDLTLQFTSFDSDRKSVFLRASKLQPLYCPHNNRKSSATEDENLTFQTFRVQLARWQIDPLLLSSIIFLFNIPHTENDYSGSLLLRNVTLTG